MSGGDISLWLAAPVGALLLLGAGLSFLGSLGLLRLADFYERLHAPTLATTLGIGSVLLASMLFFTAAEGRPVLHEALIGVFVVLTTPITLMLLARAARAREGVEDPVAGDGGGAAPCPNDAGTTRGRAGDGPAVAAGARGADDRAGRR